MIFFLLLVCAVFASIVVEHFLPALPGPWFDGARVLLVPVVFFYGALALPVGGMLALAFLAGFLWDALTVQILTTNLEQMKGPVVEISVGWSIVLYAVLGSIMSGLRPLFRRGRWEIHCLLSGAFTAVMVLMQFLMITLRRGDPSFPSVIWERVGGSGLVAALMAPLLFFTLNSLAALTGFNTKPERRTL